MTALVTPFRDSKVDEEAFQAFVEWQIEQGTHVLVPVGTTGESPTLSHEEHKRVVEMCTEAASGRVPVIAGAGSNSTDEAIEFTRHAKEAGADAALSVCPYYNKPSQEGMYLHFKAIAEAVDIPIVIYNIPGRSIVDMTVETITQLSKLTNIVGVKDATADLARPLAGRMAMGDEFCQLSGEDATVAAFLAQGGHGCISVTSNVAPKQCAELHTAWQKGDIAKFINLRDLLMPLHDAMFCEPNPTPAKYGVHLLGKCLPDARLPVAPITEAGQAQMRDAMVHVGLIN